MKKLSLLFACIGVFTFTTNAQEVKKSQQPIKVVSAQSPALDAKQIPSTKAKNVEVSATTPQTDVQPTAKPATQAVIAKPIPVKNQRAVAVPATKVGVAK